MSEENSNPNETKVSRERRDSAPQPEAGTNLGGEPKQTKPAPVGCTALLGVAVGVQSPLDEHLDTLSSILKGWVRLK